MAQKDVAGSAPKVAIVHDWLIGGGAERVVFALHQMFPEAPIFTSYATDEWRKRLDNKVVTGYLQMWPFSKLRKYIGVLRMQWFGHLDLSDFDLVISSSGNGEAFGVQTPKTTKHICYCHSPTHYYWRHYELYAQHPGFGIFDPLARLGLKLLVAPLRRWDLRASERPDLFIANSSHIKSDIMKYYGRSSEVIFPPIDTSRFDKPVKTTRQGFITVGRQTPHKHTRIIVEACTKLNLPLTVVGRGPEHNLLRKIAGPTVTFAPPASDDQVVVYLQNAKAFIFASFDDFGITPIEAMAAGTPVIAYKAGGALDYVKEGETGAFFEEQTTESLCKALGSFDASAFNHEQIAEYAKKFSPEVFMTKMQAFIKNNT